MFLAFSALQQRQRRNRVIGEVDDHGHQLKHSQTLQTTQIGDGATPCTEGNTNATFDRRDAAPTSQTESE